MRNITTNFCAVLCVSGSFSLFNSNVNLKFKSGIIGLKDQHKGALRNWCDHSKKNKNTDALQKKCLKKKKKRKSQIISSALTKMLYRGPIIPVYTPATLNHKL